MSIEQTARQTGWKRKSDLNNACDAVERNNDENKTHVLAVCSGRSKVGQNRTTPPVGVGVGDRVRRSKQIDI